MAAIPDDVKRQAEEAARGTKTALKVDKLPSGDHRFDTSTMPDWRDVKGKEIMAEQKRKAAVELNRQTRGPDKE